MRKNSFPILTSLLMIGVTLACNAQQNIIKKQIVYSELNFAGQAQRGGIKYAFEQNLDVTGTIVNGIKLVNGLKAYAKTKADTTDLLTWHPTYAMVNKIGDFGFTTGPYLYFAQRNAQPIASGYYFSIWKKNKDQVFKIIFDGGVNHSRVNTADYYGTKLKQPIIKTFKTSNLAPSYNVPQILSNAESTAYFNKETLMLRADQPMAMGKKNIQAVDTLFYVQKEKGYDESGKLFYCYGNVSNTLEGQKNGKFKGYYVQIWCFKNQWEIIAEVIQLDK